MFRYYSRIERLYRAIKKEDYVRAQKIYSKIEDNSALRKKIYKNPVTFYYSEAKLLFYSKQSQSSRVSIDSAINRFNLIRENSKQKKELKIKGIDSLALWLFKDNLLTEIPDDLPPPHDFLPTTDMDKDEKQFEQIVESIPQANTLAAQTIQEAASQGLALPPGVHINFKRVGDDLFINCGYADKDNAFVKIEAYSRGVYHTKSSASALILFKNIIIDFLNKNPDLTMDSTEISIQGKADALTVNGLRYDGYLGNIHCNYYNTNLKKVSKVSLEEGDYISNSKLAFLRAYHPKHVLESIPQLQNSKWKLSAYCASSDEDTGGAFRSVDINIRIKNAYQLEMSRLSPFLQAGVKYYFKNGSGDLKNIKPTPLDCKGYGKKIALIVGISDYKNANGPQTNLQLDYAAKDANDFRNILLNENLSGGNWDIHIMIDKDATREKIQNTIKKYLYEAEKCDLVFIFYSGHGMNPYNDQADVSLLTYDCDINAAIPGISYIWLLEEIETCKANNVVAFIDACKSGTFPKGVKGNNQINEEIMNKINSLPSTKLIMSAASGSQNSYESPKFRNGLFTYYLIKGIQGEAPEMRNDNYVDVDELFEYVRANVKSEAKSYFHAEQIPYMKIEKGMENSTFPVAKRIRNPQK